MEVVHVLGIEAVAKAGAEGGVIARGLAGEEVDGGRVDVNLEGVFAGMEGGSDVETIGRVPEGAEGRAIDEDGGGFADGRVE